MEGLTYFRETAASYFSNICFNWREIRVRGLRSSSVEFGRQSGPCAGGFHYRDSALLSSTCRNRVILWRYYDLKLELLEVSLDTSLAHHAVRLDLSDAGPLVPEVCIQELGQSDVAIMFATTTTVHRLLLPHPEAILKDPAMLSVGEGIHPSILAFASQEGMAESNMVAIFPSTVLPVPVSWCGAWVSEARHTTFALASPQGSIYAVQLPSPRANAPPVRFELRETSIVKKIWSYVPTIRSAGFVEECPVSVAVHSFAGETIIIALCRDLKLRLWSCQQRECLMVHNIMEHVSMATIENKLSEKEVNCLVLKKAPDGISSSLRFGIYVLTPSRSQVLLLQLLLVQNQLILNHLAELSGPADYTLVDFQPTNCEVWSVWTDSTGAADTLVLHAVYEGDHTCSWQRVPLLPDPSSEVFVPPYKELMEAYVDKIFGPGEFSALAISKALELMGGPLPKGTQSWEDLKKEAITRVQEEVVQSATSSELRSDEYRSLQLTCWDKFYSHCLQYHKEITKPLGVFQDPSTGAVCLIKKDCFSFVISEEPLGTLVALWKDMAPLSERVQDEGLANDLSLFLECVRLLGQELDANTLESFLEDLCQCTDAGTLARELTEAISSEKISISDVFLLTMKDKLHSVNDLESVLDWLCRALDVSSAVGEGDEGEPDSGMQLATSQLLAGHTATLVLAACLVETSHSRLLLCRDILILLSIIVHEKMVQCANLQDASSRKSYFSSFTDLVPRYHILHWMLTRSVVQAPNSAFEFSLKQLASLEISGVPSAAHSRLSAPSSSTLAELYLVAEGGRELRASLLKQRLFPPSTTLHPAWLRTLPRMLSLALRQLWPPSSSVKVCEFMLSNCQYLHLQEYCNLLEHTDHTGYQSSRKFLLGQCLIATGELSKALTCFHQASLCLTEPLLCNIVGEAVGDRDDDPLMQYYIKVMRLFEQVSAPDMVVAVATEASKLGKGDCPSTAVVWSNLFKYHLELGHHSAAYEAMINNPDLTRRKDCLQRFVVVLTERKALKELCQFPFTGLEDEVERVIESRARSVDLTKHNYYDLLYCFYTSRGNYRKSASVMYEHGLRLGREMSGPTSLQKQANCYVVTLAALSLADRRYAWIVRPVKQDQLTSSEKLPKRRRNEEERKAKQPVEVLTLADLEKEYLLVKAKLNIIQREPSLSTQLCSPFVSAGEVVSLLIQAGFFDMAIQVSECFKLPLALVFEALAARCVYLSQSIATFRKGNSDSTSWDWLGLNNTSDITYARETTLADQAWALLKNYLDIHDPHHNYQLQKCVARKLLLLGHPLMAQGDADNALITALPQWLVDTYKRTNPAELLRLYITFDLLEPAIALAMEYIDAVLVDGRAAFFGVKDTLHSTNPPVWLPHNTFDVLLQALQDAQPKLPSLYGVFDAKLKSYYDRVAAVSETMRLQSSHGLLLMNNHDPDAAMDYV